MRVRSDTETAVIDYYVSGGRERERELPSLSGFAESTLYAVKLERRTHALQKCLEYFSLPFHYPFGMELF